MSTKDNTNPNIANSHDANPHEASPHDAVPHVASEFFTNHACAYFPCHEGIAEGEFNCLFCYCPLYALGPHCGGNFEYLANGVKSCEHCVIPHQGTRGNELVAEKFALLREISKQGE